MSIETETILAIAKLLEKEMRALEGDMILQKIAMDDMVDEFETKGVKDFTLSLINQIEKKAEFMRSMYKKEVMFDAYTKVADLIEKFFKEKNNENNNK